MQELLNQISNQFGIQIKEHKVCKDTHILLTDRGKKVLKKTLLAPEKLWFVHGVKEHLFNSGFTNLDRYMCTMCQEPFIQWEEAVYTLADWIEGRECNFNLRDDVVGASRLLASMHSASKGYVCSEKAAAKDEMGKMPVYFQKRLEEIKKLKKVAKKGKSKFDYMFLEYEPYFSSLGQEALEEIQAGRYDALVEISRPEHSICHHDFAHQNIICTDQAFYVINFEFCCFELKIYDIVNLIRRKMRKCNWDLQEAKVILDNYRLNEKINEDEFAVLKTMLKFPHKFWRVANKYYNSKRSWSEKSYITKLQEVVDEMEEHKRFLEGFDRLY